MIDSMYSSPLPNSSPRGGPKKSAGDRPVVTPFARALSVLTAFTPEDRWLCNSEIVNRTGLPASTVTRMTRTLVTLGYLRCAEDTRWFCLNPSVLSLGYRAAADSKIHREAHQRMSQFAERYQVHVYLCVRERLDLLVIDNCNTSAIPAALQLGIGTRMGLASTAAGWALLASLPDDERNYLLHSAEQRSVGGWSHDEKSMRRRSSEAIVQVREDGFCVALGETGRPMTVVAAPIVWPGEAPLAVSCMAPSMRIGRARCERELGPALAHMFQDIRH
jgi:DNA-binding IclR family transcriptional regulator